MIIKWKVFLVKRFLLKGVDYITACNQKNKCPSKPEFNVNMVLLPFLVVHHHHLWSSCSSHNPKCYLSLGCPCMRKCHCSHKGMGVGIHYLVIHFHVCKKFFQALSLMSNVHHLVVLLENLLPHLDCLITLACCLDPGHYQR